MQGCVSGHGFPKLRRFFDLCGGEGTRSGQILLCVAIAPFVGARIETRLLTPSASSTVIALNAGARIETTSSTITPRVEQKEKNVIFHK